MDTEAIDFQRKLVELKVAYANRFGAAPQTLDYRGSPRDLVLRLQRALDEGAPIDDTEFKDDDELRRRRRSQYRW